MATAAPATYTPSTDKPNAPGPGVPPGLPAETRQALDCPSPGRELKAGRRLSPTRPAVQR
jgi:hypothetical protein